jgi:N-acetylglucosaminyl-diphospho-decaprenol L-rhamnosyltransferase
VAVTVVVVTRNREADLRISLPRHTGRPVIVVDNGSADATAEVATAHGACVVALGRNAGAAGRNVGVELAQTPYVAFADDDSWWAPDALGRAAQILDAHPRLGVLAARVLVGPGHRLDPVCTAMAASPLHAPGLPGPPVLGFVACGAVVRREAFLQVGGFREPYGIGGEEELLALDLVAAGWQLAYVDRVVAHHHPSPSRDPARRRVVQRRNATYTRVLRRPLPVVARGVARDLRHPEGRAALAEAARRLPWLVRERRRVPASLEAQVRLLEAQDT